MGQTSSLVALVVAGVALSTPAWAEVQTILPPTPHSDSLFGVAFARPGGASFDVNLSPRGPAEIARQTSTVRAASGAIDTVSLATLTTPAAAVTTGAGPYREAGFAFNYARDWPDALSLNAGRYDLAVTPHAGVGLSSFGRSAEAGATFSIGKSARDKDRLAAMGVRDGKAFGDQSRWYMFAAVSGKSVGLNMTRSGEGGDWRRAGWSQDATSSLVGDGQLGVGYRKGGMQAAFGYVHREIKVQNAPHGADNDVGDSMAAFTLSFRPHK